MRACAGIGIYFVYVMYFVYFLLSFVRILSVFFMVTWLFMWLIWLLLMHSVTIFFLWFPMVSMASRVSVVAMVTQTSQKLDGLRTFSSPFCLINIQHGKLLSGFCKMRVRGLIFGLRNFSAQFYGVWNRLWGLRCVAEWRSFDISANISVNIFGLNLGLHFSA